MSYGDISPEFIQSYRITLEDIQYGVVAYVSEGGLICNREGLLGNLTSKEFACTLKKFFEWKHGAYIQSEQGETWNIAGKPILRIGRNWIELNDMSGMSLFDQWVYTHLQELWKARK